MTVLTIRIFPDHCVVAMNVKSTHIPTTAVNCSVATSSSESLPNDGEKLNQSKKPLFLKWDSGREILSCKACIQSSSQQK